MKSPNIVLLLVLGLVSLTSYADAPKSDADLKLPMAEGPFKPTDESLKQYKTPEWFRDAKFGIWAHWGPQAVPRHGDWYARKLYISDELNKKTGVHAPDKDYADHLKRYGHPSQYGYKDIIPLWKAQNWDPDKLMELYKKAGAKYFVSMGSHHDNFFLWDSKIHRWNAANMGPKKDVVGLWQKAAQKQGMRFGVSEHLGASYTWFQVSHNSDQKGPYAGVPYDGNDPQYQDLYHTKAAANDTGWMSINPAWHQEWYDSIKELIDNYHPDLLYSDSGLPFGDVGRTMIAHYYNQNIAQHGGNLEAVYNCKEKADDRFVRDLERGIMDTGKPYVWQTDTSIGDWFYSTGQKYKTSTEIVDLLVDIVSKNGNLLINIVQTPEGDLEPDMLTTLDQIGAWTSVNGEGIYGTRPWKVYGERPLDAVEIKGGGFNENKIKFTANDIRFTTKADALYAFALGVPTEDIKIRSLGSESKLSDKAVSQITLLGSNEVVKWKQVGDALVITKPSAVPNNSALCYKITFAQ
ncbi:MAG: alpha-L-fucosidase [Verrucomicrobiota bacterium]|jgi:alpha-L-fucosidase|nr:MAG: alpha-L-fucosidase [Verrucomicrobiota bacterium]